MASKFLKMWEMGFWVPEGVQEGNVQNVGYNAQPTERRTATSSIVRH
jgi:hypothetical protein